MDDYSETVCIYELTTMVTVGTRPIQAQARRNSGMEVEDVHEVPPPSSGTTGV